MQTRHKRVLISVKQKNVLETGNICKGGTNGCWFPLNKNKNKNKKLETETHANEAQRSDQKRFNRRLSFHNLSRVLLYLR